MEIEGKYTLPNGEVLVVHLNVAVNTWRDGNWIGFHECSPHEFRHCMEVMEKEGAIQFEPKDIEEED